MSHARINFLSKWCNKLY